MAFPTWKILFTELYTVVSYGILMIRRFSKVLRSTGVLISVVLCAMCVSQWGSWRDEARPGLAHGYFTHTHTLVPGVAGVCIHMVKPWHTHKVKKGAT